MRTHVGTCSLCGSPVMGYRGAWHSVVPPPPDECTNCGATRADLPVIPMVPSKPLPIRYRRLLYRQDVSLRWPRQSKWDYLPARITQG